MSSHINNSGIYDFASADWDRSELVQELLGALAPSKGEKILDVCCGDGRISKRISSFGTKVIGIDIDEYLVSLARERGIETILGNIQELKKGLA